MPRIKCSMNAVFFHVKLLMIYILLSSAEFLMYKSRQNAVTNNHGHRAKVGLLKASKQQSNNCLNGRKFGAIRWPNRKTLTNCTNAQETVWELTCPRRMTASKIHVHSTPIFPAFALFWPRVSLAVLSVNYFKWVWRNCSALRFRLFTQFWGFFSILRIWFSFQDLIIWLSFDDLTQFCGFYSA